LVGSFLFSVVFFFFQAEDGIRYFHVTGVQTCALPIYGGLYEVAFGVTLGELVDEIGGGTASGRPVRAVQVGGPLGAYFPRALFRSEERRVGKECRNRGGAVFENTKRIDANETGSMKDR